MITTIFVLLVIYQLKHFIADYPLQGQYMLGKFKEGWDFLGPLTAHAGLHAVMTFCIAFYFTPVLVAIGLAVLDFVLHFLMDRLKAGPKYLGRFKALTKSDFTDHAKTLSRLEKKVDGEKDPVIKLILSDQKETFVNRWNKALRSNKLFWWSLGLDQMIHHLTHYLIIYIIVIGYLL